MRTHYTVCSHAFYIGIDNCEESNHFYTNYIIYDVYLYVCYVVSLNYSISEKKKN